VVKHEMDSIHISKTGSVSQSDVGTSRPITERCILTRLSVSSIPPQNRFLTNIVSLQKNATKNVTLPMTTYICN
jgi:hypothetical protein